MSEQNNIGNNKRIAKNTFFLYLRTLLVMTVSLYTSRVVLDVLGVDDYGLYNVVGGFVSMFSVLSGTLTVASQRFIAYELGKEKNEIKKVFSTTITIHLLLAFIIFILLESLGMWFINNKMNIPTERLIAANWVFQCSIITFCINIISIPYNAAIVAYEKMSAFAYISIFEVFCKLGCIYILYYIIYDSLIVYAIFMMLVAIVLRLIYGYYCKKNFDQCRYNLTFDKPTFLQMLNFCGWNFIGSSAAILNGQGINILTNVFFGVTLNAARGIATQVETAVNSFVQNFMMAMNPQITKSYAAEEYNHVNLMIIFGTKYAFYLLWLFALPIWLNPDYILHLWLKEVPSYGALFVQLALIYQLCQNLSQCLYTAMLATGKIKKYQIIVGGLSILAFPTAYFFFKIGLTGEWGYWAMIIFSIVCLFARLILLKDMIPQFNPLQYIKNVLLPIVTSIIPVLLIVLYVHYYITETSSLSFILESIGSMFLSFISFWFIGLTRVERKKVMGLIEHKIFKR